MHKFFSWITLIYPCILFFFISCNDNISRQYLIKAKKAKDARAYSLKIDSIQIPIANSDYSTIYYTYSTYSVNGTDYLVGYNSRHTSLDIFNLTRRSAVKQVNLSADSFFLNKLDKQDLNKGKSITDICIINLDSIIINFSNQKLIILDTALKKKRVIFLDSLPVHNNLAGYPISYSNYFRMVPYNNRVLLNEIYFDSNWSVKRPCFATLDLTTEKMSPLPIYYSDYLYDIKGKAGFLGMINTSGYQKDGLLTYNYLYESNIYQYNAKDTTITCYGATTSKGRNIVKPFFYKEGDDLKNWQIHNIESAQFFCVMYDKFRNVYYRFSLRDIPYKNGKYFNSILDKPLTLMIFNDKFEVIEELQLPMYTYAPNTWFITAEGLFISSANKKRENVDPRYLTYHVIKLSKNQLTR